MVKPSHTILPMNSTVEPSWGRPELRYQLRVIQTLGNITFQDQQNNIEANIKFGKVKKKPSDYFQGVITVDGVEVSTIYGSYMGFLDFGGIRYWDFRSVVNSVYLR